MAGYRSELEDEDDRLQVQAKVWKHMYGFAGSLVLKCAMKLGILDKIHAHGTPSITLSSLAASLTPPPDTHHLHRLLRFLLSMGMLHEADKDEISTYGLTELGELLVDGGERSLAKWALAIIDSRSMSCWYMLGSCCGGGDETQSTPFQSRSMSCWYMLGSCCGGGDETQSTPFQRLYGASVWELAEREEGLNKLINEAMASDTQLVVPAFIGACAGVLQDVRSMVDVGGGTGAAMRAVAAAFPWIKCTTFDLPHVVEAAAECNKVSLVAGNMFVDRIPSCDVVLLKFMLHNFEDGDCIRILGNCKEAIPAVGGKVIIIEIVMDCEEDDETVQKEKVKAGLDMDMMITSGGRERTAREWDCLLQKVGFARHDIISIPAIQSVIVAYAT